MEIYRLQFSPGKVQINFENCWRAIPMKDAELLEDMWMSSDDSTVKLLLSWVSDWIRTPLEYKAMLHDPHSLYSMARMYKRGEIFDQAGHTYMAIENSQPYNTGWQTTIMRMKC